MNTYPLSYGKVYADCFFCDKFFVVDKYTDSFCNYCYGSLSKR